MFFLLLFRSLLSCWALTPHQSIEKSQPPRQFLELAGRGQKLRLRATRHGVRTRTVTAAELRLRHGRRWLRQARWRGSVDLTHSEPASGHRRPPVGHQPCLRGSVILPIHDLFHPRFRRRCRGENFAPGECRR
uniref:Secreted protein n=1 Tax=Hordeum vulgare subsp. vulgare TaxID=112509 RepID=A0A8I6XM86_HORVV